MGARFRARFNRAATLSKDPNHDAVMRIGSEAPKRRTHSSIRLESQGASRDSATSNRYRRPVTCGQGRNCRGAFSVLRSLCRTQNDAVRDNALFRTQLRRYLKRKAALSFGIWDLRLRLIRKGPIDDERQTTDRVDGENGFLAFRRRQLPRLIDLVQCRPFRSVLNEIIQT
jgi:hypothetical protein